MLKFYNIGGYIVYSDGKIWSLKTKKFLKQRKRKDGYLQVAIRQGNVYDVKVHQLICMCFDNDWNTKLEVNHIDKVRSNNNLDNLEMITHTENVRYSKSKKVIRSDGKIYNSVRETIKDGFCFGNVSKCCRKERKTHKGFGWRWA